MYTITGKKDEMMPYIKWNYGGNEVVLARELADVLPCGKNSRLPNGFCYYGKSKTKKGLALRLERMKACYQAQKALETGFVAPHECFLEIVFLQK